MVLLAALGARSQVSAYPSRLPKRKFAIGVSFDFVAVGAEGLEGRGLRLLIHNDPPVAFIEGRVSLGSLDGLGSASLSPRT